MKFIGITGGTGLIGRHLARLLANDGYEIIIFTRKPDKNRKYIKNTTYAYWDPVKKQIDKEQLSKIEAMVHLAGAGIADKRWTEQRKTDIVDSRVIGTEFITSQLKQYAPKCKVLVSSSAIGYYGEDDGNQEAFTEGASPANDFLGRTCVAWEDASEDADNFTRRVVLRMGIVLAKGSGAFNEFLKPMKWGVMPILGSGEQIVSWIHVKDAVRLIRFAIERVEVSGVYNAVAPVPVTHSYLMHAMGKAKKGWQIPVPVPGILLKIMLGEMSIEVLKSATVSAEKIQKRGFRFEFRDIEAATKDLLKKAPKNK